MKPSSFGDKKKNLKILMRPLHSAIQLCRKKKEDRMHTIESKGEIVYIHIAALCPRQDKIKKKHIQGKEQEKEKIYNQQRTLHQKRNVSIHPYPEEGRVLISRCCSWAFLPLPNFLFSPIPPIKTADIQPHHQGITHTYTQIYINSTP